MPPKSRKAALKRLGCLANGLAGRFENSAGLTEKKCKDGLGLTNSEIRVGGF
jgi:hypothetical protein